MGIVRFALRFPYTFYVIALLALLLGISAIVVTPRDVLPSVNVPVVTVIWQYTGLTPQEMEQRVTTYGEYYISSNVSNIRNMESQTLEGLSVTKIYFQPNVNIDLAISQIVSATNTARALMPTGIQPPVVVQFNATSVPVLQLSLTSDTLNEQQLYDYGLYQMRQALAPIPGITLPTPSGGRYREIMVDLDPDKLRAYGITPADVVNAVNAQSLTLPAGDAKLGTQQFIVHLNGMAPTLDALEDVPIRQNGATTVFLHDVAHVHNGWQVQSNVVRANGQRSVLLTIIKNGDASTLDVVNRVKAALPAIQAAAPAGLKIGLLFDQSTFVQDSIDSVLREGAIAAGLTALMILIFLGSWRATIVVMVSIPLSILTSIAVLSALGETLNIMTLGGMALAVGILVDDSTVTIENTYRMLEERRPFDDAVLEGAAGIALPTLISTSAICCVFVAVFFMQGAIRYIFTPLALAVVFAMIASYGLSRTLTPIIIRLLLRGEHSRREAGKTTALSRAHAAFDRQFNRFREFYAWLLAGIIRRRAITLGVALAVLAGAGGLFTMLGHDFFPAVDAGMIQLHVRLPPRTRIETAAEEFSRIEDVIRGQIPQQDLGLVIDNIGLPQRSYNLAFTDGTEIGPNDGVIQIQLNPGHRPTEQYIQALRRQLPIQFPDALFYVQPSDIVTQVLNFGVPSQIDVQIAGRNVAGNQAMAQTLRDRLAGIPGLVDVHVQQELKAPELDYTVDRTRAQQLGLNMTQVANDVNISLSSSTQVQPNFWTDPASGIAYYLAVQTPEYRVASLNDLNNTPIGAATTADGGVVPNLLGNIAAPQRAGVQSVFNQSNIQEVYDVYASVDAKDLGRVATRIQSIVGDAQKTLQPGNTIAIRGQISSMDSAFRDLGLGLTFAAIAVYLLMVVNYQSFRDPLAVLLALPGAMSGIVLMLFVTGTSLSVPSLMGAIMAVGVASANSILLVTFARDQSRAGHPPFEAALSAGVTRLRPVLMTAAAMVVGMLPMAIGGPGEEQNAALARAVIGGVSAGTLTTLLFVPFLYALIAGLGSRRQRPVSSPVAE
ncbi:multidrug efflux pump subunit AcrB [Inquilinus ginsengisoli]|uniref:efflux RND transporter permease subunit n=1 Tax=Inquilinus ginsengisoli TaxID=363840 RepID=UPI003D2147A8